VVLLKAFGALGLVKYRPLYRIDMMKCTYFFLSARASGFTLHVGDALHRWQEVAICGNASLQYLPVPLFVIFKNLTIVIVAYGERLWYDGRVTPMMLLSFGLMVPLVC
jgi:hypothetical protein